MPSRAKWGHQSLGPRWKQSTLFSAPWVGSDLLVIVEFGMFSWHVTRKLVIKSIYGLPLMCSQGSPPSLEVFVDLCVTHGAVSRLLFHNDLLPFDTQLNNVLIILYRNAIEKWQFFQCIYGWEGGLQQCMKGLLLDFTWPWGEVCLSYRPHGIN